VADSEIQYIEQLMAYWKIFISMSLNERWPDLARLNFFKNLISQKGKAVEKISWLVDTQTDVPLIKACTKMLNFDQTILHSTAFDQQFEEQLLFEFKRLQRKYENVLMTRERQEGFVAEIEQVDRVQMRLRLTGLWGGEDSVKTTFWEFKPLYNLIRELYFLHVHKVCFSGYGVKQISYTHLDADLFDRIKLQTDMRHLEHLDQIGEEQGAGERLIPFCDMTFDGTLRIFEYLIEILEVCRKKIRAANKIVDKWHAIPFIPQTLSSADLSDEARATIYSEIESILRPFFEMSEAGVEIVFCRIIRNRPSKGE